MDVKALERIARTVDYQARLLRAVEGVNDRQKLRFYNTQRLFQKRFERQNLRPVGLCFQDQLPRHA
jgi:UDPglucose 6-dehydrogenase